MVTKYDTGDEVLVPVKIRSAMSIDGEIFYTIQDAINFSKDADMVIPEGLIEGKAKIERERYHRQKWDNEMKKDN